MSNGGRIHQKKMREIQNRYVNQTQNASYVHFYENFYQFSPTDLRPGKIFRECDHVYEKLFSYNVMNTKQEDGCYPLNAEVNGKPEKGAYCVCSTELCNEGTIVWPPVQEAP